jgi:hypothetical protein
MTGKGIKFMKDSFFFYAAYEITKFPWVFVPDKPSQPSAVLVSKARAYRTYKVYL